jgi:hypothetical protein
LPCERFILPRGTKPARRLWCNVRHPKPAPKGAFITLHLPVCLKASLDTNRSCVQAARRRFRAGESCTPRGRSPAYRRRYGC